MVSSAYRAMWVLALFDLPVKTKKDRRQYQRFRATLIKDGFIMLQYSVYARFCANEQAAKVHRNIIKASLPPKGQVRVVMMTDKQFEKMEVFLGKKRDRVEKPMAQLEFF